ncbi:hypothetical protein Tsubulata_050696, partial [Turnera subulata]
MAHTSFFFVFLLTNFLLYKSPTTFAFFPTNHTPCHDHEKSALLQFKNSFVIDERWFDSCDPKFEGWKVDGGGEASDCCLWDAIECDDVSGHVISLGLSSSCLYGSINSSTSSLFQLLHLRSLNLAYNDFHSSSIPSALGHLLTNLTYLNLSFSGFSGPIPSSISNYLVQCNLQGEFPTRIYQLPRLEVLFLDANYLLTGHLPEFHTSSPLRKLSGKECNFWGHIPSSLQNLTKLAYLNLKGNSFGSSLSGLGNLPKLTLLGLSWNQLTGPVSTWLGNHSSLEALDLSYNNHNLFSTPLRKLLRLRHWYLRVLLGGVEGWRQGGVSEGGFCRGDGEWEERRLVVVNRKWRGRMRVRDIGTSTVVRYSRWQEGLRDTSSLSWMGNLAKLSHLSLVDLNLSGEIPSSFANLTNLSVLRLPINQLTGPMPKWLRKLTQLTEFVVAQNELEGMVPRSLSELRNLEVLDLRSNKLNGPVDLDMFLEMQKLYELDLSGNFLSFNAKTNLNATFPKFETLRLESCNLRGTLPELLRDQDKLEFIDLGNNSIHGQIPPSICNLTTLGELRLGSNHLSGRLPSCLGNFSANLWYLDIRKNNLSGMLSDSFSQSCNLEYMLLNGNRLAGKLPRSLANCKNLRALDLRNNQINDVLPSWLFSLPLSDCLLLSSNNFHGEIPPSFCNFTLMNSLLLDKNDLSGTLPPCLANLTENLELLNIGKNNLSGFIPHPFSRDCRLEMIRFGENGLEGKLPRTLANCRELEFLDFGNNQISDVFPSLLGALPELKILILRSNRLHGIIKDEKITKSEFSNLQIVDLSQNNFVGGLPSQYFLRWEAMKMVKLQQLTTYMEMLINNTNKGIVLEYHAILDIFVGLRLLNLSNNDLTGGIPSSLGNLSLLETLDLSGNKLSGKIPQELARLGFLEVFNVSNNNYLSELCGNPLTIQCFPEENTPPSISDAQEDDDGDDGCSFGWKPVATGYASGLLLGVVIGSILVTKKYEWCSNTFGIGQKHRQRRRRRARH